VRHLPTITTAALALAAALLSAPAAADIVLNPGTAGMLNSGNSNPANCEAACVETAFGLAAGSLDTLLYKSDEDGVALGTDSGLYAASYQTTFSNSVGDPSNALLEYLSGAIMDCDAGCYLAIKDGRHMPSYYFYNLAGWNGTESIVMQDFWPAGGAISHISIWAANDDGSPPPNSVPEPGSLALAGLALAGAGLLRRRKA
jgi:PEP-CTERM motif